MSTTTVHTTDPDGPDRETEVENGPSSSRRAIFAGSAAAAAAVVAGAALGSGKVQAIDGQPINAGVQNTATERTELVGPSFVVTDGDASGSLAREVVAGVVTGVHGFTARASNSRAVWGLDQTTDGVGVYGGHWERSRGTGVVAESFNGPGLVAQGTGYDVILQGTGELRFAQPKDIGPTSPGLVGTLARDAAGTLWYCVSPNRWQRIADTARTSTFVPIDPTRVYDSRSPAPIPGSLSTGAQRVLSVRDGRDIASGGVTEPALVPFDASAISYNLTIARTVGNGYLSIAPGDAPRAKASSINWTGDAQTMANAGIVKIDGSGNVKVFCDGPGGSTDLIVDVTGYYA